MDLVRFEAVMENIKNYDINDILKICRAYEVAKKCHEGQIRNSGEPYITHPINVAYKVSEMKLDGDSICAALLHDVVEDTSYSLDDIEKEFGSDVALLVDGVTKINKKVDGASNATLRKIISSCQKDIRIILIKLCDRLHNMQTLEFKSPEKQKKIALETIEIYTPLAYYLGAYRIKHELEDLSLKYLEPNLYEEFEAIRYNILRESSSSLISMEYAINDVLREKNIPHWTKMRIKNIYGIYNKMVLKNQKLNEIHDLLNLKVMVDTEPNCYLTLRDVHKMYHPINSKFKDYICNPKTNLYQSLHTTVFAPDNRLVQVQIKTFDMDTIASYGIASFWDQKQGAREEMQKKFNEKFQFINSLKEIDSSFSNNDEYIARVKEEVLSKKIYVYDTNGNTYELPEGSNSIDLAYAISNTLGDHIDSAIINGVQSSPVKALKDNDVVQIITNSKIFPLEELADVVHTTKARRRIKEYNKIRKLLKD